MKRLLITIGIVLLEIGTASGQSTPLDKINEIKSQKDVYFWDQCTLPDADSALIGAARRVLIDVNIRKQEKMTVEELLPKIKHINIYRGNLTRVFAYVKITDVLGEPAMSSEPVGPSTTNPSAVTTRPVVVPPQAPSPIVSGTPREFVPEAFIQKILQRKDFYAVYQLLKEQKAEGQVLQFGSLKDVEDYSSFDLIVFDLESKEIVSILSPITQGNTRTNLTTGQADSLDNYPEDMVAVIWYIK